MARPPVHYFLFARFKNRGGTGGPINPTFGSSREHPSVSSIDVSIRCELEDDSATTRTNAANRASE